MNTNDILLPVAAQLLLIAITAILTVLTRRRAALAGKIKFNRFKTMDLSGIEDKYVTPGNNYNNQFQIPMLFLAFVLFAMQLQLIDTFFVAASWAFVVTRYCHTLIHLTTNHVVHRLLSFALGLVIIFTCWFRLIWLALG